jgi:hypothetical protein
MRAKKNWFSWGWLIFWILVSMPIAFIYLAIKYVDRTDKKGDGEKT